MMMTNPLNVKMSVVRRVSSNFIMADMTFDEFLHLAAFPKTKEYINMAREYASKRQIKGDGWDLLYTCAKKHHLQAACVSGIFNEERKEKNLVRHTGLICIDIDGKDNPNVTDWEDLKKQLGEYSCIAYAALSLSGDGIWCVIPIDKPLSVEIPDISAPTAARMDAITKVKDLHERQFKALQTSFQDLGLIIDPACVDLSRLRVLSSDPNPYRNENAKPFTHIVPPEKPTIKTEYQEQPKSYFSPQRRVIDGCTLDKWLTAHGVAYTPQADGDKYNVVCPWENLHSSNTGAKETCVFEKDGKWCFHCFHAHCADKGWNEFREMVAPRARVSEYGTPYPTPCNF